MLHKDNEYLEKGINYCQAKNPTYKGCEVCEEWHLYSNFKKWYNENYYEIDEKRMELDKDILHKGNKIYSPNTCVLVSQNINSLFIKSNAARGSLPIGICLRNNNKYQVNCNMFNIETGKSKLKHLGIFNTPEEAFVVYKQTKEDNIKLVANYYKQQIPTELYNAMITYKVDIDD